MVVSCIIIQNKSKEDSRNRNGLLFLTAILIVGSSFLIINAESEIIPLPSYRYLNAINPFLTTTDPLVDSVSEHATTTLAQSFLFHSILMVFAGLGVWFILKNSRKSYFIKKDMISFSLIIGITGVYVSSAFVRLEVFASIAIIILSSLGLSVLVKEFFSNKTEVKRFKNIAIKIPFVIGIIILLTIPLTYPAEGNTISITKNPPTILNGGTSFTTSTSDWGDTLEWIKNNTPEDAVIGAWWDYGYWIQTKAERASLADNSTVSTSIIKKIATIFLSSPDEGWKALREMQADYFVVFVAAQRLGVDNNDIEPLYVLGGGGDESKKQWFMRIAQKPLEQYLHSDGMSGTDYFWNETMLGQMFPFTPLAYANFQTNQQSTTYQPGYTAVYTKDIKFPTDGNGPFRLVYSSPSFDVEKGGQMIGVFVYEVNKDYTPKN